jgi:hypothetical protein
MYLTPIRLAVVALPAALVIAACGQVTGLSDNYTYDLEGGATATDGGGDGAKTDATTGDGATDAGVDAANKCSAAQTLKATDKMSGFNGTDICKACLATSCCTDVDTCSLNQDCTRVFSCKLDCTDKAPAERTQCFKSCTSGGGQSPVYTGTVGQCGPAACASQCGLQ